MDVGTPEDFPANEMKGIHVRGHNILIVNLHEKLYAVSDTCTHELWRFSEGWNKIRLMSGGFIVTCPGYFAQFDIRSGKLLRGPAARDLQVFEVKVADGRVLVKL